MFPALKFVATAAFALVTPVPTSATAHNAAIGSRNHLRTLRRGDFTGTLLSEISCGRWRVLQSLNHGLRKYLYVATWGQASVVARSCGSQHPALPWPCQSRSTDSQAGRTRQKDLGLNVFASPRASDKILAFDPPARGTDSFRP